MSSQEILMHRLANEFQIGRQIEKGESIGVHVSMISDGIIGVKRSTSIDHRLAAGSVRARCGPLPGQGTILRTHKK